MRTSPEQLLPLFRSRTQVSILARLFLTHQPATIRELHADTDVDRSAVTREIDRLANAGVVTRERVGRTLVVSANPDLPWAPELEGLLTKTVGVAPRLRELFANRSDVTDAYIYGSWAERYYDVPGTWPRDIDLVVIGDDLQPLELRADLAELEPEFGVEINPTFVTTDEWGRAPADEFLGRIKSGPLVSVAGGRLSQAKT
jgi:predicted nucleotidyltransferase